MAQLDCVYFVRKLRRATNRRRMGEGTAQAIDRHFTSCERCRDCFQFGFKKRYSRLLGMASKMRPPKTVVVAAPVVPTEATNGTVCAAPSAKPKRARRATAKTATGTPRKSRTRRPKPATEAD